MIWKRLKGGNGRRLLLYVDGAIRPHATGLGVVVRERTGRVLTCRSKRLPRAMTCNQAEYEALILGLAVAHALKLDGLEVRSDSQIVINQMLGRFSVRKGTLRRLHARASAAIAALDDVELVHVPRERNRLADALANEAAEGEWERGERTRSSRP
jgi:ribonuclease HI